MDKPISIKKKPKDQADQNTRLAHKERTEKSILKMYIYLYPDEAKKVIREMPERVYN